MNEEEIPRELFKVDIKRTLLMGFGFFSCMLAWSFYNFKIPIILNGIMSENSGEWIRVGMLGTEGYKEVLGGILMTLDNIIAILLQPYFGKLSDRLMSKYGRRSPFVMIGIPVAVFSMILLPFCPNIGIFIAVIVVFNLAMAFYRPSVMSILPDKTPPQALSRANSYISLMGGLGVIVGMLVPTLVSLMPNSDPEITGDYSTQNFFLQDFWGFFFTGLFMLISLLIFIRSVKEIPTGDKFWELSQEPIEIDVYTQTIIKPGKRAESSMGKKARNKLIDNAHAASSNESNMPVMEKKKGFLDDWREIKNDEDKSALYILLAVFSYLFGFNALEFSFGRFATSYYQIDEGTAGLLLAIMPVMLILAAVPAGILAEKYGRLKIMKIGLIISSICTMVIIIISESIRKILQTRPLTMNDLIPLAISLSLAGVGYGFTHINALPVVWQLAPKDKIGSYTGVYYMVSAMGSILSPIFMSTIYWIIRSMGGNQWNALFPYYLVGLLVGFIFVSKAKRGDAEPLTAEELARLRAIYRDDD